MRRIDAPIFGACREAMARTLSQTEVTSAITAECEREQPRPVFHPVSIEEPPGKPPWAGRTHWRAPPSG